MKTQQIKYQVPISKLREREVVQVMDVVKRREAVWKPVKLVVGLFLVQLIGFGVFLWIGGSVS